MNKTEKGEQLRLWAGFFLLAVVLMTFGSMTSFLFPLHTGVDQNCFLSVAKAMAEGKVLYADIYEQKGPLLYVLHLPAAWLPKGGFFGVYAVQILCWVWILFGMYRLAEMYLPQKECFFAAAAGAVVIVTAFCYSRGDNAEEYCLPLVLASLYDLLHAVNAGDGKDGLTAGRILKNGVFAGCVLWIKFTMLGFYIGWCVMIGIYLWRKKSFWQACRAAALVLGGMLLATVPWIIYFVAKDAVSDWMYVYFYSNIALYPRSVTFWQRISDFFAKDILWNPVMMPVVLLGAVYFARAKEMAASWFARLGVAVPLIFTYVFVFIGGVRYRYYLLILGAFVPFGIIALLRMTAAVRKNITTDGYGKVALAGGYLAGLLGGSNCLYFMGKDVSYYPQVQFASVMAQTQDATLLNYGFLDGGYYLMSGSPLPESVFFCRLNIPREALPLMYEEQERLIAQKAADYVVIRWEFDEIMEEKYDYAGLYENYRMVATSAEAHDEYYYALWVKNP